MKAKNWWCGVVWKAILGRHKTWPLFSLIGMTEKKGQDDLFCTYYLTERLQFVRREILLY